MFYIKHICMNDEYLEDVYLQQLYIVDHSFTAYIHFK